MIDQVQSAPETSDLLEEVQVAKQALSTGALPDARAFLDRHPSVRQRKAVAIDLIYEEFCRRRDAGEALDAEAFAECFPTYRSSLRHRLGLDSWVYKNQHLIPAESLDIWPKPGATFGEFTVLRDLGRGSFARVYLATEASTGDRPVVLKLALDDNPESRTLGRLSHENIVPVLSARRDETTGFLLLCMPYLGSATLHDVLDHAYPQTDSPPPRRARVLLDAIRNAEQPGDPALDLGEPASHLSTATWIDAVERLGERLAAALAFAHARGVLHRDIKPSNILLDAAGRPRLLDFNLSDDERIAPKFFGGTPEYMGPEQLRLFLHEGRDEEKLDGRADLFALAVILYELLTGKHPFGRLPSKMEPDAKARFLLERQQIGCTPLRTLNPRVDRRLAVLIESCLAFEAKDRPASAATLAAVLRRRLAPKHGARILVGALSVLLALSAGFAAFPLLAPKLSRVESSSSVPSAEDEYRAGQEAFNAEKFKEAEDHFLQALQMKPHDVTILFACGRNALAQGIDSLTYLEHASELQPDNGQIWAARAYAELLRRNARDRKSAIYSLERALKAGFETKELLNNLAYAHRELNEFDKAEEYANLALDTAADYVPARYNRALVRYKIWHRDNGLWSRDIQLPVETLDDILSVLEKNPQYADLHVLAARIYGALAESPHSDFAEKGRQCVRDAVLGYGQDKEPLMRDLVITKRLGSKEHELFKDLPSADPNKPALGIPLSLQIENPIQDWLK
jgi:eukaryotic-like serine/threonine-protein kinase